MFLLPLPVDTRLTWMSVRGNQTIVGHLAPIVCQMRAGFACGTYWRIPGSKAYVTTAARDRQMQNAGYG